MWKVCGKTSIEMVKELRGTEISETTAFWDVSGSGAVGIQSKYSFATKERLIPTSSV